MPQPEQEIPLRTRLAERARELGKTTPESLFRTGELGTDLGFEIGRTVFERVLGFCAQLDEGALARLPLDALQRIDRFLAQIEGRINAIRAFRVTGGSQPLNERNNLVDQMDNEYRELFRDAPIVAAMAFGRPEKQREIETAMHTASEKLAIFHAEQLRKFTSLESELTGKLNSLASEQKQALHAHSTEANAIVQKLREASGRLALHKYSEFFDAEAKRARKVAYVWAAVTALIAGAKSKGVMS